MPTPAESVPRIIHTDKFVSISTGVHFVAAGEGIAPNKFNVAHFFQSGLMPADEMVESPIITPPLVILRFRKYHLVIVPGRLQFTLLHSELAFVDHALASIFKKLVDPKSGIVVGALALNLEHIVAPVATPFEDWSRAVFGSAISSRQREGRPRYGTYFSFNHGSFRMKFEAKPVTGVESEDPEFAEMLSKRDEWITCSTNCHLDVTADTFMEKIQALESEWKELMAKSNEIVASLGA